MESELRERIAEHLYGWYSSNRFAGWKETSEERRRVWLRDADAVLALLQEAGYDRTGALLREAGKDFGYLGEIMIARDSMSKRWQASAGREFGESDTPEDAIRNALDAAREATG